MAATHNTQRYRQVIEEALAALGRDDVGVGGVSESSDGILRVTFSRGPHTHTIDVALDQLRDREHARAAINVAVLSLSKDIAQEAIKKALALSDEGG